MASMTDYLKNAVLNHVLRNTAYTSPAAIYVGLYTTATSDAGGGTEVVDNYNYSRKQVSFSAPSPAGVTTNSGIVDFGAASGGNWGTISHFALHDSATHGGGNMLLHAALANSRTINDTDSCSFGAGELDFTIT